MGLTQQPETGADADADTAAAPALAVLSFPSLSRPLATITISGAPQAGGGGLEHASRDALALLSLPPLLPAAASVSAIALAAPSSASAHSNASAAGCAPSTLHEFSPTASASASFPPATTAAALSALASAPLTAPAPHSHSAVATRQHLQHGPLSSTQQPGSAMSLSSPALAALASRGSLGRALARYLLLHDENALRQNRINAASAQLHALHLANDYAAALRVQRVASDVAALDRALAAGAQRVGAMDGRIAEHERELGVHAAALAEHDAALARADAALGALGGDVNRYDNAISPQITLFSRFWCNLH